MSRRTKYTFKCEGKRDFTLLFPVGSKGLSKACAHAFDVAQMDPLKAVEVYKGKNRVHVAGTAKQRAEFFENEQGGEKGQDGAS